MSRFNALWKKRATLGLVGMAMIGTATTAQAQSIIRRFLEHQGIEAVIPPRTNRKRLLSYDKLAKTFMAFVHLVCAFVGFQKN